MSRPVSRTTRQALDWLEGVRGFCDSVAEEGGSMSEPVGDFFPVQPMWTTERVQGGRVISEGYQRDAVGVRGCRRLSSRTLYC
jgi:hypothetical protein